MNIRIPTSHLSQSIAIYGCCFVYSALQIYYWSEVINDDTFSAKAAKKVDWTQISASSLDSAALAKLKQDTFSGKNKKLSAWLDANTTSTTGSGPQSGVSFAGIAEQQASGVLASGQDSGGSATQVLMAAAEKQPGLL